MTAPIKLNFKIYQGSTFKQVLRWESETKVYVPITNIAKSAPVQITVSNAQQLPPLGWRARVTNVGGMREINTPDGQYQIVTNIVGDTLEFNQVNSLNYTAYTSGGVLEYNQPASLDNTTARMQLREKIDSDTVILELTTENGGIIIDNTTKTIQVLISAAQTALLTFSSAVYSVELVKDSTVTPFVTGSMSLVKEVTR